MTREPQALIPRQRIARAITSPGACDVPEIRLGLDRSSIRRSTPRYRGSASRQPPDDGSGHPDGHARRGVQYGGEDREREGSVRIVEDQPAMGKETRLDTLSPPVLIAVEIVCARSRLADDEASRVCDDDLLEIRVLFDQERERSATRRVGRRLRERIIRLRQSPFLVELHGTAERRCGSPIRAGHGRRDGQVLELDFEQRGVDQQSLVGGSADRCRQSRMSRPVELESPGLVAWISGCHRRAPEGRRHHDRDDPCGASGMARSMQGLDHGRVLPSNRFALASKALSMLRRIVTTAQRASRAARIARLNPSGSSVGASASSAAQISLPSSIVFR